MKLEVTLNMYIRIEIDADVHLVDGELKQGHGELFDKATKKLENYIEDANIYIDDTTATYIVNKETGKFI